MTGAPAPQRLRVWFTTHAIHRFRERCRPDLSFDLAKQFLVHDLEAAPTEERTHDGAVIWQTSEPGLFLVVRSDRNTPLPACVTIVSSGRVSEVPDLDDVDAATIAAMAPPRRRRRR